MPLKLMGKIMCVKLYKFFLLLLLISHMQIILGLSTVNAAVFNVANFGASANDDSDDLTAIQAAINNADAGDTVFIPDGIYNINQSIVLTSALKITGQSQSNTIILFTGDSSYSMVSLSNVSNVEVKSLTLDGNNRDLANAIYAEQGQGHNLHHLTIKNLVHNGFGPHGILFSGNSNWENSVTHSVLADNTFINIGLRSQWGAAVRLANGASHNQILRNTITDTGRGGILANQGSTDLIIRENHIIGIGQTAEGLSIEVHTECNRSIIEDNIVDHWISLDKTNFSAVRRNIIRTEKKQDWKYAALELAGGTNNIFTDNVVDRGTKTGISISTNYPKEYVFWGRNSIKHAADWGAQLQGETQGLRYHYFYKNVFSETYQNHAQSTYPEQGHGFRVNGNSHHIVLEGNTIRDNQGLGIQFNGADIDQFTFINNTITGNKLAVVSPYTGNDLQWSNNSVNNNGNNVVPASTGFIHNVLPIADFISDTKVKVNTPMQFTNSSLANHSAGGISHVLWDFDDGIPSTKSNPTFTYTKAGEYTVTLIVWNDKGRAARREKIITVIAETDLQI
jgi:PKD repeat protein